MLTALIMAGGKGTRFWPMSTEEKPKQFLNLIDELTMIQSTVKRLKKLINIDHIFVCTIEKYKDLLLEQLPDLPQKNIIIEPIGRNTAPCILLSTIYIKQLYSDANIIVLPSDHKINDEEEFIDVLKAGNSFINKNRDSIVTIGIVPNRPETGYGYINFGDNVDEFSNHFVKKVNKFVEKPNLEKAKQYVADGKYLWNAGMFAFNSNFMLEQFQKYFDYSYNLLASLPAIEDENYMTELYKKYQQCDAISVDYAIMEKSDCIYVIPSDFGWDDIGSWNALERYIDKDGNNNIVKGNVKIFDSQNNVVYGTDKEILLVNVDDLYVIETDEKIVIGKKDNLESVHELRGKY